MSMEVLLMSLATIIVVASFQSSMPASAAESEVGLGVRLNESMPASGGITARQREGLAAFARCVAHRDPRESDDLIASDPGSPMEEVGFARLSSAITNALVIPVRQVTIPVGLFFADTLANNFG
jgi:hypothetical protein